MKTAKRLNISLEATEWDYIKELCELWKTDFSSAVRRCISVSYLKYIANKKDETQI